MHLHDRNTTNMDLVGVMIPNSDGPDVSRWNPVADWDVIPQYRLFIAKATGTSRVEIRDHVDPAFHESWQQMRRRGFEFRGAYHWLRPDIPIVDQVELLHATLDSHGGLQVGEFVMLDWERSPGLPIPSVAQVEEWLTLAEKHWPGRLAVYSAEWVTGFREWRDRNPDTALFYANYRLDLAPAKLAQYRADVWQWSSTQPVPGIDDPTCDMNAVLNWSTLEKITGKAEPVTRTYQWGYGDERCTLAQLETKWSWSNVHPEMRRRAIACANAAQDAGHDLGFGEGARNPIQQIAEFFRRHDEVVLGGCCRWNGKRYKLKAGMAPISPPGSSNHDDDIYEGCALAIDFVGWEDHWFDANCERFGIKNFGGLIGPGVNKEEWHGQPLELPNSRKDVDAYFAAGGTLKVWPLPGTDVPEPPPPTTGKQTVDMILVDLNPGTDWWVSMLLVGTELSHNTNGHTVAVLKRGSVPSVTTNETELLGMLRDVSTTNASPFAPGMPAFNQALHGAWLAAA